MTKLTTFSLIFILFSCGGGGGTSSVASNQPSQTETITFKNVPENLSIFE